MCTKEIDIFCLPLCVRKRLASSVSQNVYERDVKPKTVDDEGMNVKKKDSTWELVVKVWNHSPLSLPLPHGQLEVESSEGSSSDGNTGPSNEDCTKPLLC